MWWILGVTYVIVVLWTMAFFKSGDDNTQDDAWDLNDLEGELRNDTDD